MGDRGIMLKGPLHYQGIAKVPFIWQDPKAADSGQVRSGLGSSLDISSTVLARAAVAPFNGMQGMDLGPLLSAQTDSIRDGVLIEQDTQTGNFGFTGPIRARTYVTQRWRLSVYQGEEFAELYDLHNDPHEMHNVWHTAPERSELMRAMIDTMAAMQGESPLPFMHA